MNESGSFISHLHSFASLSWQNIQGACTLVYPAWGEIRSGLDIPPEGLGAQAVMTVWVKMETNGVLGQKPDLMTWFEGALS